MKTPKMYGRLFFELAIEDCVKLNKIINSRKFKTKTQFLRTKISEEVI